MSKPIMSIKILEDFTTYTNAADDWITEYVPEAWEAREVLDYIAEMEADNAEFRQLIRDWSIVLEQDDFFQLWHVESVRQAMLEINKEREE